MLHEKIIVDADREPELIKTLEETFQCKKSRTEASIIMHNEDMDLTIKLITSTDDKQTLILDYPQELKKRLEDKLSLVLVGKSRLPTLMEFSKTILSDGLSKSSSKQNAEQRLKQHFNLSSRQIKAILADLEKNANRKRANTLVKKAWSFYNTLKSE